MAENNLDGPFEIRIGTGRAEAKSSPLSTNISRLLRESSKRPEKAPEGIMAACYRLIIDPPVDLRKDFAKNLKHFRTHEWLSQARDEDIVHRMSALFIVHVSPVNPYMLGNDLGNEIPLGRIEPSRFQEEFNNLESCSYKDLLSKYTYSDGTFNRERIIAIDQQVQRMVLGGTDPVVIYKECGEILKSRSGASLLEVAAEMYERNFSDAQVSGNTEGSVRARLGNYLSRRYSRLSIGDDISQLIDEAVESRRRLAQVDYEKKLAEYEAKIAEEYAQGYRWGSRVDLPDGTFTQQVLAPRTPKNMEEYSVVPTHGVDNMRQDLERRNLEYISSRHVVKTRNMPKQFGSKNEGEKVIKYEYLEVKYRRKPRQT